MLTKAALLNSFFEIFRPIIGLITKICFKSLEGLRMTIQLGSYKTTPCQSFQNDPTITRSIIWNRETSIVPTPAPKAQLPYGPIYGSGHKCQVTERHNYALDYQFSTFEEATRFCKSQQNICGILVELTLKGTL